jgi:hypothetical protein
MLVKPKLWSKKPGEHARLASKVTGGDQSPSGACHQPPSTATFKCVVIEGKDTRAFRVNLLQLSSHRPLSSLCSGLLYPIGQNEKWCSGNGTKKKKNLLVSSYQVQYQLTHWPLFLGIRNGPPGPSHPGDSVWTTDFLDLLPRQRLAHFFSHVQNQLFFFL